MFINHLLLFIALQMPVYNLDTAVDTKTTYNLDINKDKELKCLTQNIYFEARNQPIKGQIAVAQVTLNRVESSDHPDTICGVVKQKGQFSWVNDDKSNKMVNKEARAKSKKLALAAIAGKFRDSINGAKYFHLKKVKPHWSKNMKVVACIGDHIFYKN